LMTDTDRGPELVFMRGTSFDAPPTYSLIDLKQSMD
jgi:hypothetical protein